MARVKISTWWNYLTTKGNGCGSVGRAVNWDPRFRIQSSANFVYFQGIVKTKITKKRPEMAHLRTDLTATLLSLILGNLDLSFVNSVLIFCSSIRFIYNRNFVYSKGSFSGLFAFKARLKSTLLVFYSIKMLKTGNTFIDNIAAIKQHSVCLTH